MPRETEGILVRGDRSAITFLRHITEGNQQRRELPGGQRAARALDEAHVFIRGDDAMEQWLDERIDAFVTENMLEPPEEPEMRLETSRSPHGTEMPPRPKARGMAGRGVRQARPSVGKRSRTSTTAP